MEDTEGGSGPAAPKKPVQEEEEEEDMVSLINFKLGSRSYFFS